MVVKISTNYLNEIHTPDHNTKCHNNTIIKSYNLLEGACHNISTSLSQAFYYPITISVEHSNYKHHSNTPCDARYEYNNNYSDLQYSLLPIIQVHI